MNCTLKTGCNIIVAGPTSSGKTDFILKLIANREEIFEAGTAPKQVFWFYGTITDKLPELRKMGFTLSDTIPESFDNIPTNSFVVLDDMMEDVRESSAVTKLFTQLAHHRKLFVIFSNQNIFPPQKQARTRSLNAQYIVLFKNPRDMQQVAILGQQMYPHRKHYLEGVFENATSAAHAYLLIDLHQDTSELVRLRARIFPDEDGMNAYVDKRLKNRTGCIF